VLIVGLTGRLGAGKSSAGRALAARGAVVVDADAVSRQVLGPGSPGERRVLDHFGPAVTRPDGELDRRALAQLVFAARDQRLALEAITHPLIYQEVKRQIAEAETAGAQVVVVEVPLLDDARTAQYGLDVVVLVDTPVELALRRAVRRGMVEEDARARMAAQPTDEARRSLAARVLDNSGNPEQLDEQVNAIWLWLQQLSRSGPGDGPPAR
jgi:dephospho-CoA kinase